MANSRKKKKKKQSKSRSRCPHCGNGPETFRFIENVYLFDVDLARKIVSDGREPIELEPDDVKYSVDISRIYPQHLKHVNVKYPGIIAHYWFPEEDGTVLKGQVLIDGHHRAARTLELEVPFYVHILNEDESQEIMLKAPDIHAILGDQNQQELAASVC